MKTITDFASGFGKILRFILADSKRFFILIGLLSIITLFFISPLIWDTVSWSKYPDWLGGAESEPLSFNSDNQNIIVNIYAPSKLTPRNENYEFMVEIVNNEPKDVLVIIEITEEQTYIDFVNQIALPIRQELLIPAESSKKTPIHQFKVLGKNRFYDPAKFKVQITLDNKLDWVGYISIPIDLVTVPLILIISSAIAVFGPLMWWGLKQIKQ